MRPLGWINGVATGDRQGPCGRHWRATAHIHGANRKIGGGQGEIGVTRDDRSAAFDPGGNGGLEQWWGGLIFLDVDTLIAVGKINRLPGPPSNVADRTFPCC